MPFYRLNKEYNQQGIYMSETTNPTAAKTKTLSLIGNGADEPFGFCLLMTPYKAELANLPALTGAVTTRNIEIVQGNSRPGATEQYIKDVSSSLSAADLKFSANLYTTKEINKRDVPRIIFPLPVDIRDQLLINYQGADMGLAGAAASFGADLARNIREGKGLDMGADTFNSALLRGLQYAAQGTNVETLAANYLGSVPNPFTVTTFRNVEPRVFNFEFRITPANKKQSENLQECINTLRYCALPDPTASGLTLAFPYRFKLAWLGALKMFDFSEAVLSRIEVNYAAGGSPAFFDYVEASGTDDGSTAGYHPVSTVITLEFRELFPLTKETIIPRAGKKITYDGQMVPRKLGRTEFDDNDPLPSPAGTGGATSTDPAENQTGAGDDALNTPTADNRATVQQAQSVLNKSAQNIDSMKRLLISEGEGGSDAFRAEQGLIPATDVYLNVNKHDAAVTSYNDSLNVLKSNPLSSSYVKDIQLQQTWLQKVQAGTSGSRSGINVWQRQYNRGNNEWNKTSGGGP
jgi:hypothetical protein